MFLKRLVLIAILLYSVLPVVAQNKTQEIDKLVAAYHNMKEFDGTVLVARKGQVILRKAYGMANRETNTPNTPDTRFRIASLTKQFTAMLIMQLKEKGQLGLQDPISKYLPYYRKDIGNQVTIHQLLTHTSGIPDYTARPDFGAAISTLSYSTTDFVKKYCSDTLISLPGKAYNYNNGGYYLLGAIIESITGKKYATVLKENIFDVVGMKNSGVDDPRDIIPRRANGYNCTYGDYSNSPYINMLSSIFSAGAIYSTVDDLYKWNTALHQHKLLSKANTEIMFTPYLSKYAYGIAVNKFEYPGLNREITFHMHTGAINGTRTAMTYELEDDIFIVLLSNLVINNTFGNGVTPISNRIFSLLQGQQYDLPKPSFCSPLGYKVMHQSADAGIAFFHQAKSQTPQQYDFSDEENFLNSLGYYLVEQQKVKDAVKIFRLNTEEFPNSGNAFDSYGEALMNDGQLPAALENYKKSLQLDPSNRNAAEQIKLLEARLKK